MARFDPIKRREELRAQREDVTMSYDKLSDRVELIAAQEDPAVRGGGGGRTEPRATRAALEAARVAEARGEPGAGAEVLRLGELEAEIARELSDAHDALHILARGKMAVEADLRKLHRDHLDVFAEAAEEQVAEVLALGEQIADLTARYVTGWQAAQATWKPLALDNDLPAVGRCPLVGVPRVAGVAPRPLGVRRDDDEVQEQEQVAPGTVTTYHHLDGREVQAQVGTGMDDAMRSDPEWVAAA